MQVPEIQSQKRRKYNFTDITPKDYPEGEYILRLHDYEGQNKEYIKLKVVRVGEEYNTSITHFFTILTSVDGRTKKLLLTSNTEVDRSYLLDVIEECLDDLVEKGLIIKCEEPTIKWLQIPNYQDVSSILTYKTVYKGKAYYLIYDPYAKTLEDSDFVHNTKEREIFVCNVSQDAEVFEIGRRAVKKISVQ